MVGRAINAEFRRVDKVVRSNGTDTVSCVSSLYLYAIESLPHLILPTSSPFLHQVVVTDSWIILARIYTVHIALQSDVDLSYEFSVAWKFQLRRSTDPLPIFFYRISRQHHTQC